DGFAAARRHVRVLYLPHVGAPCRLPLYNYQAAADAGLSRRLFRTTITVCARMDAHRRRGAGASVAGTREADCRGPRLPSVNDARRTRISRGAASAGLLDAGWIPHTRDA